MARMHSGKKGKAGSKKPIKKALPTWVRYTDKEIKLLIVKLAKEGKTPSHIGIILRDTYGIPDIRLITKQRVTKLLKEKEMQPELPEDLMALIKKNVKIVKHIEMNKQDETAKRGLHLTESKINRLVKYYKREGVLPADWSYNRDQAQITI